MTERLLKYLKRAALVAGIALVVLLGARVYDSQRGAPLDLWHTFAPHEMAPEALDHAGWSAYLGAEDKIFGEVRREVTDKLPAEDEVPANRYFAGSPVYPGHFAQDWNRSYELVPEGPPKGAVVLLHGLTDSPYSLRHIGRAYRERGFVVVAPRLPGHGTTPGALAKATWEDWMAATRLAVREAREKAPAPAPLEIVGFSNGGALALKYALDAVEDETLARPSRLVLISPMVGITRFARFAGLAGLPAFFPAFAKAAWLGVVPEFNPFKYNSFPVNGARQSYAVTQVLQGRLAALSQEGRLKALPPILTFQSVVDFTVSTRAIIGSLYNLLPAGGGHELVLFDLNRNAVFGQMLRLTADDALNRLLPPPPRAFAVSVVANASPATTDAVERRVAAGSTQEETRPLGLSFPPGVFSLSHVALPFPLSDSLYGLQPDLAEDFGVNLGALAPRGERGTLIVSLDSLLRMSSNPFFPYMLERVMTQAGEPAP
ncbi:alpha/beta hydrolase [Methylocella sp.]|uniref:alpha/beta hydrolase n=1 Tax=Methylocella sp. TaxID=1978226 RepID=UPI0035AEA3A5